MDKVWSDRVTGRSVALYISVSLFINCRGGMPNARHDKRKSRFWPVCRQFVQTALQSVLVSGVAKSHAEAR